MKIFLFHQVTRDFFPLAKIHKNGFRKVFNVWTKSHFSTFEVGWRLLLWSQKCLSECFLDRYKKLLDPSKLRNSTFLGKCLKWNLNLQKWSKGLCLDVSEPKKRLATQSTETALSNQQGNQVFVKENENLYLYKRNLNL